MSRLTSVSLFLSLLTLSSALPTRRGETHDATQTVQDYMQTALSGFLKSQGVQSFSPLGSGWEAIDYAGGNGALTGDLANDALYTASDQQQNVADPKGPALFFSNQYIDFVEELEKALGNNSLTTEKQGAVDKANDAWKTSCMQQLPKQLNGLISSYTTSTGETAKGVQDPGLLQYAAMDPEYQQAQDECQAAYTAYQGALASAYGDDNAVFQAAINNIGGLNNPTTVIPGVTMEVSSALTAGSKFGKYKPYYSIPVLNGTLDAWQQNTGPGYTYDSSSESGSTSNKTTQGGGGLSFIWEDLSGSGSGSGTTTKTNSTVKAQSFYVHFAEIALMSIDRGVWFDSWASASALQSPADDVAQSGVPAFKKYFGSAEKPGPLSSYKDQALVVYQPSFAVQFSDASEASEFAESSGSASACFLFICAGGSGSQTTNNTHYTKGSSVVTFNDTSSTAYIVGYTYKQFWTGGQSA